MNTKALWVGGAVIILLVAGYILMTQNASTPSMEEQEPVTSETPAPSGADSMGKINIDVVCQGALAYMSFPDGEAAAKFVAECKAGEHPEVIEKYKADMNLGDGAAI